MKWADDFMIDFDNIIVNIKIINFKIEKPGINSMVKAKFMYAKFGYEFITTFFMDLGKP